MSEVRGMMWGEFKPKLAEAIVAHLGPMQHHVLRADEANVLNEGATAAEEIAQKMLTAAKVVMGFSIRK